MLLLNLRDLRDLRERGHMALSNQLCASSNINSTNVSASVETRLCTLSTGMRRVARIGSDI